MTEQPFFTILTACLNSESSITATLESVKGQIFRDFEHVVIDGESTDNTANILKEFSTTYQLSWSSEPDEGIADALNKGLARSRGRYILVIQADDILLDQYTLERVYPLLKDEHFDIYSFPVLLDHPRLGKVLRKPIHMLWWNHFKFVFLHQGTFVHQRTFEKVGAFRKEFSVNLDYDFFYRALALGCSVGFEKFPVAIMGAGGIGSNPRYMAKRLEEERKVQILNERNLFWRSAQFLFAAFYRPYKKAFCPVLR